MACLLFPISVWVVILLGAVPCACEVRENCTTRPQLLPASAGTVPRGQLEAHRMWQRLSEGSSLTPGLLYSHCWTPPLTEPTLGRLFQEIKPFQDVYGHPRYCPEQRHNLLAQPQYSELDISFLQTQDEADNGSSAGNWATITKGPWYFKGMYYFGPPGRIGLRNGNPGYPMGQSPYYNRVGIYNGQVAYTETLLQNQSFSFQNVCTIPRVGIDIEYAPSCLGWDIEMLQGVWEECINSEQRNAYANYMAVGYSAQAYRKSPTASDVSVVDDVYRNSYTSFGWYGTRKNWNFYEETMRDHNCTTCTGKFNLHTRVNVSNYDEGPNDWTMDPYNPWSFTVSMNFPTYVQNFSGFRPAAPPGDPNFTAYKQSRPDVTGTEQNFRNIMNNKWATDETASQGYSPSNYGSTADRWDRLTERGQHLHSPPENWGASFEPTRALVRALMICQGGPRLISHVARRDLSLRVGLLMAFEIGPRLQ